MLKRILTWWFEACARQNADHEHRRRHADLEKRVQNLEELRADEMRLNARLRDVPVFSRKLGTIHQLFKD